MLPWILLAAAGIYFLARKESATQKTSDFRNVANTPGSGWTQNSLYKDRNNVTWQIYSFEGLAPAWQGIAAGGAYANQVFQAASYGVLKIMIDAFAAASASGKTAQDAYNAALTAAGFPV